MYSYGSPHMAAQKQDDQLEHTYSSYVRIRDVALKTCQRRWTIGRSGERGSGISVLAARHDDDEVVIQNTGNKFAKSLIVEQGGMNGAPTKTRTLSWKFATLPYLYLPTPPLGQDMTQGQFFKSVFNRFEFRVFLLLDWLLHQGWRT